MDENQKMLKPLAPLAIDVDRVEGWHIYYAENPKRIIVWFTSGYCLELYEHDESYENLLAILKEHLRDCQEGRRIL